MRFRRYLARRVLYLVPVWLAISLLAFGLGALAPGDPAEAIYFETFGEPPNDELALEKLREEIVGLVHETMQPAHASLWLRQAGTRRRESSNAD